MMHVTALYRSLTQPEWKIVATGSGSSLRWATAACFVQTSGHGFTYEEVKSEHKRSGDYVMEARVTRRTQEGVVAAEWRIVPSPGSKPDENAPAFVAPVARPSTASRILKEEARLKRAAGESNTVSTRVAVAPTKAPALPPVLRRRPLTIAPQPQMPRQPLTSPSLDSAQVANVPRRRIIRRQS